MKRGALLLLLLLNVGVCHAQGTGAAGAASYSWRNVWRPQDWQLWRGIHEKCGPGGGGFGAWRSSAAKIGIRKNPAVAAFVNCVAAAMARAGASPEAVQFTRQMDGEVYMGSFREMGRVDLASSVAPLWNDPNVEDSILVNGTPRIVTLWEQAGKLNIERDPAYEGIRARFPEVTMWPMHIFVGMSGNASGGQRFVFSFLLLNGCRACEIAGDAEVAFDFDKLGRFLGARLLRLVGPGEEAEGNRQVKVKNFREFVEAVAPNTSITLEPGEYVVEKSAVAQAGNPYVVWAGDESRREQHGLTIRNVERLFISGPYENGKAIFIQPDESQAVLIFDHTSHVSINHVVAGHSPVSTWCWAGVFTFYDSDNVWINSSELYGSGLYGLTLDNVRDLQFGDSVIRDCSYKIMEVSRSDNLNFTNSRFFNNGSFDLITVSDSSNVFFDRIQVTGNRSTDNDRSLFHVTGSRNVTLTNSTIRGNDIGVFEHVKGSVSYDRSNKIDFTQFKGIAVPAAAPVPVAPAATDEAEKWRTFIRQQFALIVKMPKPKRDWPEILALRTWGNFDTYQELYLLAVNRRNLAADALSAADGFLNKGDLPNTRKYAGRAAKFYTQSNELFNASELTFAGSVEMTAETLNAIYRGSTEALKFGLAAECGPKCAEVADFVTLMTDYAVDNSIVGADEAKRNAFAKALTMALLKSSGLSTWAEKRAAHSIGASGLYQFLDGTLNAPAFQKEFLRLLAESGEFSVDRLINEVVKKAIQAQVEFLQRAHNLTPEAASEQSNAEAGLRRLTSDPAQDREPSWSPDGEVIVFTSTRLGGADGSDLFAVAPDGSNERPLLQFTIKDQYGGRFNHPSWLRSGDLLVVELKNFWEVMRFRLREATKDGELPVRRGTFNDDSPYLTRLLFVPGGQGAGSPVASPDGSFLVWHALVSHYRTGESQRVYEVRLLSGASGLDSFSGNTDSAGRVLLRTEPGGMIDGYKSISVSPDGARICVAANLGGWQAGKRRDLYIIWVATGRVQRLTTTGERGQDITGVAWSSRNTIAFTLRSDDTAPHDLYTIKADGTELTQLTRTRWDEVDPTWSPEGDRLAFSSNAEGNYDLYLAQAR